MANNIYLKYPKVMLHSFFNEIGPSLVTFLPLAQDASACAPLVTRCPFSADGRDFSPSTMDVDYEDDAVEVSEVISFANAAMGLHFLPQSWFSGKWRDI